jgi:hypothetical protein
MEKPSSYSEEFLFELELSMAKIRTPHRLILQTLSKGAFASALS